MTISRSHMYRHACTVKAYPCEGICHPQHRTGLCSGRGQRLVHSHSLSVHDEEGVGWVGLCSGSSDDEGIYWGSGYGEEGNWEHQCENCPQLNLGMKEKNGNLEHIIICTGPSSCSVVVQPRHVYSVHGVLVAIG